MQQLETAEVKMEQKLASMMTELGSQLKQAEETNLPLKRKKRQAKKEAESQTPSPGGNPMAKYSLADFVKVLKSMRTLRAAFDKLLEGYRDYKNKQEEEQADKRADEDKDTDDGDGD